MMNTLVRPAHVIVNALHRVWRNLSNHIVQDVPERVALCEFDCRKPQCTTQEWASCERRLKEAGRKIMPVQRVSFPYWHS
jgi:hypothetical protein